MLSQENAAANQNAAASGMVEESKQMPVLSAENLA